ncbi:MAG: PAS domain S-box protein, partial [Candidatus Cloacimonetes bacterium]|nr:PAS domain S-box protein [Candidatus Cloacimonadota bacterium]
SPPEIHPEDSREEIIKDREEHIQEKKVFTANVPCQKKDGTIFYANINSVNTKIGNKNYHIGFFTDVTEQKKAQEEIKRSAKELSTIYENVPLIMMLVDKERRVKKINGSGEKFTGRSAIELLGMKGGEALRCLHHLDDPRGCGFGEFCEECKVRNTVLDTFKTGEPHIKVEATLPFKIDGEKKNLTFLVSTSLLNIEEEPLVLVTILDITERKKAEKIQKRLMERVEAGLRAGNLAWWEMELPSGKVTFDARKAEVLGYSADDFETYKDFTKLLHPDDYQKAMNAMRAHLKGKAENYEIEYRIKTRDGSYKWFRDIGGIVEREDDDQTHVIGIVEDITERKKAQKELQKSEKRFRSYIEHSPDGIFVANKKGDYLSVNKAACEVTGYSKDELLDMNLLDLIPSEAKEIASKSFQTLPEKGKVSVEVPFQKKDGSLNYWIVKAVKLSENRYLGFVHIITERKEAEKRLNIAFEGTIKVISDILEVRDAYTAGHQRRVAQLAKEIADDMDIAEEKEKGLEVASSIHDLGKIIIPAQILSKPTELTDLEFSYIKQHPVVGYEILKGIEFPWSIADIVHQHHERLDGSGYPQGLEENEIMKEAKILAVADVVEAMSSQRPYRPSLGMKAALDEIKDKKGKLYDPKVVESCLEVIKSGFKFIEIKSTVLESNKK